MNEWLILKSGRFSMLFILLAFDMCKNTFFTLPVRDLGDNIITRF